MIRRTLPQRRAAETFDMRFWNQSFSVTIGFYPDGTPGEVFIDGGKTGQDIQSTARDAAVVLSLALQHGTAIETIRHAVTRNGSGQRLRSSVRSSMRFRKPSNKGKLARWVSITPPSSFLPLLRPGGPWVLTAIELKSLSTTPRRPRFGAGSPRQMRISNAEQNARRNLLLQSRRHERCSQRAHRARF